MFFRRREQPTGFVPNPEQDNDPRNINYEDIAPFGAIEVPESGDVEQGVWTLNQGHTASCTCHSTVYAIYQAIGTKLSPRYAYKRIKTDAKYASSTLPYGAYMIDSVKCALNEGLPAYDLCPNVDVSSDAKYLDFIPSQALRDDAKTNTGGAYVYVNSSGTQMDKSALLIRYMHEQQKALKVGITWYTSFNNARNNGIVSAQLPTGNTVGHDMLAVAWKKINGIEYIGFRNSFGENWGDKGRIWIPRQYLKIQTAIGVMPLKNIVLPPKVEERDILLEKYKINAFRKILYEKFPLDVNESARAANTIARSWAGRNWLGITQALAYRGWTNTDIINFLYAYSRGKTATKAFNFNIYNNK